jgi:nicotinate phosphoribosyltransferase
MESFILNILGFSIISATLAARCKIAAKDAVVVDFGLRRTQGPIASIRTARAAQIAGFIATSNLSAAKSLNFTPTGTMAHSFIQVHDSEEQALRDFTQAYKENAILLVDTYDSIKGIKKAAKVAKELLDKDNIKIKGIRLDSGDLVELSKFARIHFQENGLDFIKILASGDLDEFKISDLLKTGAEIDGFGIGTRFGVSIQAPATEIVYKIVQYSDKGVFKTSPEKQSRPGRKSLTRIQNKFFEKDIVTPYQPRPEDLLKSFEAAEEMETIQERLADQLASLPDSIKVIKNPQAYHVEFIA